MPRFAVAPEVRMASSQPARRGDCACQHEGDDQDAVDLDAGAEGGVLVAADHHQVPAERRLGHDEARRSTKQSNGEPCRERQPEQALDAEPADGRSKVLRRAAAGDGQHDAAHPDVAGEGDDEGVHLHLDDEEAVDEPDGAAYGKGDEEGCGNSQPVRRQLNADADAGRTENDADRHGAERGDRLDRQIHMAGDDHQREPDRHHAEHQEASMMLAKMPGWK